MNMVLPKQRMKVPEFLAWANQQLDTNYELVDGEVVASSRMPIITVYYPAMQPERLRHNLVKAAVYRVLDDAVKAAGLPCTVFTDGVGVVISDHTTRIPDASVQCGVKLKPRWRVLEAPLIVVEVAQLSIEQEDFGAKLIDYLSVSGIHHYLAVLPEKRAVLHHKRSDEGGWLTYIGRDGDIRLDPPGITVPVAGLLGPSFDDEEAGQ
jgi:Uma2 family endonuclease